MMKSSNARMREFVQYHINGDGECNTVVLVDWANKKGLSTQKRFELAYFFSISYSVVSAIVLFLDRDNLYADVWRWAEKNKKKIIFQSDRKYMRMRDSFEQCVEWFSKNKDASAFLRDVSVGGKVNLEKAIGKIETWKMFGRFSAFLFLEMFLNLIGAKFENTTIDWRNGNTATSGLLNLFCFDNEANAFDRSGKLLLRTDTMDNLLLMLLNNISNSGGSANVTEVETSLCAYRKFYKGSRYNGYYLDRMLEELNAMKKDFPKIVDEIFEIRAKKFNPKYLGEVGGWSGIRSKLKKLYRETGMIT